MREHNDSVVSPIYDWLDSDIWEYIRRENIEVNPLYERGYKRVGCIGCPLASYSDKMKEFADYPKYKEAYIRAFGRMLDKRNREGKKVIEMWTDAQAVFDWWLREYKDKCRGQMTLDDYV
jgi:phosphoadenosine phosphosulfate reductase